MNNTSSDLPEYQPDKFPLNLDEDFLKSIISSQHENVTLLLGPPGTGKSTKLLAARRHIAVERKFKDGIYFFPVRGMRFLYFIGELLQILSDLRLRRLVNRIKFLLNDKSTVLKGIKEFFSAVRSKSVLLMFDDIHSENEISEYLLLALKSKEVFKTNNCKIIISSTNDLFLDTNVSFNKHISFPTVADQKKIIYRYSGDFFHNLSDSQKNGIEKILVSTKGIPIFLMIAGMAISNLREASGTDNDPLGSYIKKIGEKRRSYSDLVLSDKWLSIIVLSGIDIASEHDNIEEIAIKLSIFPPCSDIPFVFISLLGKEKSKLNYDSYSKYIFHSLTKAGVIESKGDFFVIHECVHQILLELLKCKGKNFIFQAHKGFLFNYFRHIKGIANPKRIEDYFWEVFEQTGFGNYITSNLIRHFALSGRIKETLYVLTDYRWTEQRVYRSGSIPTLEGLTEDVCLFLKSLPPFSRADYIETPESIEEIHEGLSFILDVSKKSEDIVSENPEELAFQIYGRLAHKRDRSQIIRRYLLSMDRRAEALRRQERYDLTSENEYLGL